jgi:GT2 family glycosyltransferase
MAETPRVTIVIAHRERFGTALSSLDNVLADKSTPFHLIYVDGGSPGDIALGLRERAQKHGFNLIRREEWIWPHHARAMTLPLIETEYAAYLDNDISVEAGWLGKLVAAADETGAALVGPLYLWGGGNRAVTIHMSGGKLTRVDTPQGVAIHEAHVNAGAQLSLRPSLKRQAADFIEFHCILARTSFLRSCDAFDPGIVCVHEHIDLSMKAAALKLPVIVEPSAAVTYYPFLPFLARDLAFFRWRWSNEALENSIQAFCKRWNAAPDEKAFWGVRFNTARHRDRIDPLSRRAPGAKVDAAAMLAEPRAVALAGLIRSAQAYGYTPEEQKVFSDAYFLAARLFNGGYRACGRPFLNHVTGTAAWLIAFGASPALIVTGLLHAAYSHGRIESDDFGNLDAISNAIVEQFGQGIESYVRAYARYQSNREQWLALGLNRLTVPGASILCLAIANSLDDILSGTDSASLRHMTPDVKALQSFAEFSALIGAPELGEAMVQVNSAPKTAPPLRNASSESFTLDAHGDRQRMTNTDFAEWDARPAAIARKSA